MLTTRQKAAILAKADIAVPVFPARRESGKRQQQQQQQQSHDGQVSTQANDADHEHAQAVTRWNQAVDALHTAYATARAVRSLREAEQVPRMATTYRADSGPSVAQWGD